MKIAIYGATGAIGQQLVREALQRGHDVTAVVRDPSRLTITDDRLKVVTGDATDTNGVAKTVAGQDAVIGSISGRRDQDSNKIVEAARSILTGVAKAHGPRFYWVGGAGTLEVAPGVRLIDTPQFPDAYKAEANAGAAVLDLLRTTKEDVDWTFLSPAAIIAPGERTGKFRLGGDQLLVDANGDSRISIPDYAIALIDEIEHPQHLRQRFTVAY